MLLVDVPTIVVSVATESTVSCARQFGLLIESIVVRVVPPTIIIIIDTVLGETWCVYSIAPVIVVTVIIVIIVVIVVYISPVVGVVVIVVWIIPIIVIIIVTSITPVVAVVIIV